jgi:predicted Ser/Thr protein kinase
MKCRSCGIENLEDSRFCRKCATPLPGGDASATRSFAQISGGPAIGSEIAGKYKISRVLGRGGMGVVYLADDLKLKRPVALKFLPPEVERDALVRQRFLREAQAAAALSHPNICTIYEVDDQVDQAFISMEYVEGECLRDMSAKGPFPFDDVLDIAIQVCLGLDEAHKKGIVHRDIKSANIMLTATGQVKIMDFGLAKMLGAAMVTREGSTMGTVAYMSPEQARGEPVDARTDLWALGVVLYELATGKLPFAGDRESAIIHNLLHEEPKPLRAIAPKIPMEFERIIRRALKKRVDDRYTSAAEMLADLKKLHAGLEEEKGGVFNLRSFIRIIRKPLVAIPTAVVLIGLGVVAGLALDREARVRRARQVVLPELQRMVDEAAPLPPKEGFRMLELYDFAARYLPADPQVRELAAGCVSEAPIRTTPPGVRVFVKDYCFPEREWRYMGTTPIEKARLPNADFLWKMEKDGYQQITFASSPRTYDPITKQYTPGVDRRLDAIGTIPADMVRIPAGKTEVGILDEFLIDRYEVTNKKFKEFVDKGGYRKEEYWKQPLVDSGKHLTWDEAMTLFVDTTGRPGPSTWQGGSYPEGQGDYPVSGVSWYEAAAYAEYAGLSLPTGLHWGLVGLWEMKMSRYMEAGNFGTAGPVAVGSLPSLNYYGAYDLAGNVREWCWEESPQGRIMRGGAWNDATYMYVSWSQAVPFDRSPKNGFRCVRYGDLQKIPQEAFELTDFSPIPDFGKQEPVPDAVFKVYKEQFSYDNTPLNATVEWRNESGQDWIQEKVSFDAAYGNERVTAYLLLPRDTKPPFQTVIYFPSSNAPWATTSNDLDKTPEFKMNLPFIVKDGRAVLYPVYKGTFERHDDALRAIHCGDDSRLFTEYLIQLVKDLSRSIDYLETRPDIDRNRLAYLANSWGGLWGAIIPAVEGRLKVSVLRVGGLWPWRATRPEASQINYVRHVTIPTLMLNGKYDMGLPYDTSVKPMFDLLGTPEKDKVLKVYDSDHFVPQTEFVKETLAWLDKYFGRPER